MVSPLQQQLIQKAAEEAGSAAEKRNQEKLSRYHNVCQAEGIEFLPVVVETLGGWHKDGVEVISKLARQLASHTGGEKGKTLVPKNGCALKSIITVKRWLV